MEGLMFFVHVIACVLIIAVILMQSGRGGGLTEGFASAESMFGAQTNEFMIKATTVLATVFLITSLTLAVVSAKKEVSVMSKRVANAQDQADKTVTPIVNTQK